MVLVIFIFGRGQKQHLFHLPSNFTASLPAESWHQSQEWISAVAEV